MLLEKQLYATYFAINYSFKKAGGGHLFPFDLVNASLKAQQGIGYFCRFTHLGNLILLPFEVVGILLCFRKGERPDLMELIWPRHLTALVLLTRLPSEGSGSPALTGKDR